MKIVIAGPSYPLRAGGMSTFNERLARAFMAQGHEVVLLTFSLQYPSFLFPGKTQWSDEKPPKDLNIDVAMNSVNPLNWIKVGIKYQKMKPDLVIFRYWMPFMAPCLGTIARIVSRNRHTRCIAITDNIIPHEKRKGDHTLTQYFVKSVAGFVAMSRSVLDDIGKFDQLKPRKYIPHPLYDGFGDAVEKQSAKRFLKMDEQYNYLLFFGFIRSYKGLDLLLQALSLVDTVALNLKLIVAGEFYGNKSFYMDLIQDLKLSDAVILHTDFIPNEKVPYYFGAADMVAQTYKSATQSGVTQIAYNYFKPMLVTDVGGLAELVPHQKVGYVCKQNAQEIADCIKDFYKNNRESDFVSNIKEESKKFSWDSLTQELISL